MQECFKCHTPPGAALRADVPPHLFSCIAVGLSGDAAAFASKWRTDCAVPQVSGVLAVLSTMVVCMVRGAGQASVCSCRSQGGFCFCWTCHGARWWHLLPVRLCCLPGVVRQTVYMLPLLLGKQFCQRGGARGAQGTSLQINLWCVCHAGAV
jgi:hypothetical protein